jgi:hypothetical protein
MSPTNGQATRSIATEDKSQKPVAAGVPLATNAATQFTLEQVRGFVALLEVPFGRVPGMRRLGHHRGPHSQAAARR